MENRKKLNKSTIDGVKAGLFDIWIWDTEVPGFGLRCTPHGRKVYVARYRTKAGQQRKQVIARACDVAPDKARDMARKLFQQVTEGADPIAERRAARPDSAKTVEAMFRAYVATLRARGQPSAPEVERCLLVAANNAADALGRTKPASSVTAAAVVDYVASIFNAGHRGAADKHRGYVSAAFGWAIKSANDYTVAHRQDWGVTHNPVAGVAKDEGARGKRDRNLSAGELKAIWQAARPGCEGFAPETAACVRILIACGQRVRETLRVEGSEIDLEQMLWTMPAAKTKCNDRPHTVPIPKVVRADFALLKNLHGDGLLFPARRGAIPMHDTSVMQAIERWCKRAGAATFQTRDLRRTWKSRTHDAGIDRFMRDLIQQHSVGNDTGSIHYDRANYLPQMREAMTKWSAWIDANLEEKTVLQAAA